MLHVDTRCFAVGTTPPPLLGALLKGALAGSRIDVEASVKRCLYLSVERASALLRVRTLALSEVALALSTVFVAPADLPAVTFAVLGCWVELGSPPAVFPARFVSRSGMTLVPAIVDAHAAPSCC